MEAAVELGQEEESESEEVPPIATTPPRRVWKEDSLSRSSSETQASVTSGISLGEAIRQKTASNWGIESWYQLPAEVDASSLAAALETRLGLTCNRNDLTEFSALEEGVLPSAEASRRRFPGDTAHGILLDIQNTQFPPCLPLLTYSTQGQRFSDVTLLQQSEVDFIPLRAVPDVSGVSEEHLKPLHVCEAVSDAGTPSNVPSDCFTLSQHPLPFGDVETCDGVCGGGLSQQTSFFGQLLVNKEADEDCKSDSDEKILIPQKGESSSNSTSKAMLPKANGLKQIDTLLAKQTCNPSVNDEHFSRDSHVPATSFELSEKAKGLLRQDEFSSSENSSCKTVLNKCLAKNEREVQKEKVKVTDSELEGCTRQLEKLQNKKTTPELDFSNNLSDDLRKDHCKNSGARDSFSIKPSETGEGMLKEHGVDLNGSESSKLMAVTEEPQGAFLDPQQKQLSPAVRFEKEEFISPVTSSSIPEQLVVTGMESEKAPVEEEPVASRSELTISDFSIERGHKFTGISPSFNLLKGDGSFFGHLAYPDYQSTPGIFLKKNTKVEELGVLVIKSDQACASCLKEETSGNSSASIPASEKQQLLQCTQKEDNGRFESLKLKYPLTGRIQSLPSLGFMEKVQAWNMSPSEEMSNALASCDPDGVSPRRKAYSAIFSSSNNILSIKKSSRDSKDSVAASFREAGTASLGNLCFPNKNSLLVHPLTRSQSDNAVNVSSRNMSWVEVIRPANSTEAVQPLGEKSNVLGMSESVSGGSMIQKFAVEIVPGSSGEDAESNSTGRRSDLNVFVLGEGVAQVLKGDVNSPTDDQKNCDALENLSHNLNTPAGCVSMDKFDFSPDSLNLPISPGESSQGELGSAGCSSVVSRDFTSAKEENFTPIRETSLESPVKEELNIEERIPIYLRNLGIDQSPGTILTPFLPRGPIREVEFSPSELRTLKDCTDTLIRATPQRRGNLLSAVEIPQTSFNLGTSALSMSMSTNSEVGSDILSPCQLSPCFSRSFGETPSSQGRISCQQLERTTLLSTERETECLTVSKQAEPNRQLQGVSPDCHSDRSRPTLVVKGVEDLLAQNESKAMNSSLQRWPTGSLAGVENEVKDDRGPQTSSIGKKRSKGQEVDQTQPEICNISAEGLSSRWCNPVFSTASCRETDESSPVSRRMEDGPEDSSLGKDCVTHFEKLLSRDETVTQRSLQEDRPLNSNTGNLRWENSPEVILCHSEEMMKEITKDFGTGRSVGRSEPEGCSNAAADRNQPGFMGPAQSTGRTSEVGNLSSEHLNNVPGGIQSVLSKAGATRSRAGGTEESNDSSSGDSLAACVKTLLGNPPSLEPLGSVTDVAGGFPSALSKAGASRNKAGGTRGSDDSSSGDSLAACVRKLLKSGSPGVHGSQIVKRRDEEEREDRAWVKLKLASQSEESLLDLNEENQQRMEEIKTELLWRTKKSTLTKGPWMSALDAASSCSHDQELDMECSKASSDRRFQTDKHTPTIRTKELVESSLWQAEPLHKAELSGCGLAKDPQFKTLSTIQTPVCNQHQTFPTSCSGAVELHPPVQKEWDTFAMKSAVASNITTESHLSARKKLSMEKCSEDVVKQITSITFSSRKRLQSPLTSMALNHSLTGDDLDGIMPLEVDSASTEKQSHDKQLWKRSKTCLPSPVLVGTVADEIAYSSEKDRFHCVSTDSNRVGTYQETDCLSDQHSVSIHADKRQTLSEKHSDVLPQDATELGRHHARVAGLGCDVGFSQEMYRFNGLRSLSSYQQEKSSPHGHIPLCESLEGSGPAVQSGLLKGPIKVLEEEKESPSNEVPPIQKETAREQIVMSHCASSDGILSTMSSSPSPSKKVLSCVHITLSSKANNSQLQSDVNTETEMRSRDKPEVSAQPVPLKTETLTVTNSKLSTADFVSEDKKFSSFPTAVSSADPCSAVLSSITGTAGQELPLQSSERPQVHVPSAGEFNLNNVFSSVVPTATEKTTSDAATQITTENPGKTTFSVEIYVNSQGGENAAQQLSLQKHHEPPNNAASSLNKIPSFPRQDQPLLLPYKPSGSTGMYYVPYLRAGSKTSPVGSEASMETSHSGSNDALPSSNPSNILGLRGDGPRGGMDIHHKEGIYSKRTKPKLAWAEEQMVPLEVTSEHTNHSKSVKTTHSVFKSTQFHLHHPVPRCESFFLSNSEASEDSSGIGRARPSSRAVLQNRRNARHHQRAFFAHHKKDGENEFFPLTAETDYSKNEDLNVSASLGSETSGKELLQQGKREAEQSAARNYSVPCSQTTCLSENEEKDLPPRQRTHSSGSLDELWIKFLEHQKKHQHHELESNGELSLVERLNRLSRVLQNPIKHILLLTKSEMKGPEEKMKGRGQKKIRLLEKSTSQSTLEPNATHVKERPHITHGKNSFAELTKNRSGEETLCHINKILEHEQYLETPSDTSSETRLSRDHGTTISSTTSESDTMTHTEMETATPTEVSSSISTIDTARLMRAFGHERVQVSPRLSQLYYSINRQKSRLEKWDMGMGKAVDVEYPKVAPERHRKRKEVQKAMSISSDSASASSSSWGPSSVLTTKRRTWMLNKGIQAGDLEIVNSATKKNTRDVGMTFRTTRPRQPQEPRHLVDGILGKSAGVVTDQRTAGNKDKEEGQPGMSWFVQAEHAKSESRKENHSKAFSGPGSSWFEPLTSTKPWREPLREKNWQEQKHSNVLQPGMPERDAEKRSLQPFVKLTLQEALAMHRPDFISRSRERVKHLKLVMEERRIQSVLQSEREELFNPPEKRKGYRNASQMLSNRGFLKEKIRTISKSEMVQRSKRIYEQLPEVQKKREEEKRRMEYKSYRLKAQLYKEKITNRVLGRKVPWN